MLSERLQMIHYRKAQIRKNKIGWSWRLWWGEGTYVTRPGWHPRCGDGCRGWSLTEKGAERAARKHLAWHRMDASSPGGWRYLKAEDDYA